MSVPSMPRWWSSILGTGGSLSPNAAAIQQQAMTVGTQTTSASSWPLYTTGTYATGIGQITPGALSQWAGSSVAWTIPVLTADVAAELITQFEDDRALLDDKGRLKFGKYRHKRLCKADLQYLVALGRAINKVRQGIAKDLRARRALARITQ